MSVRSEVASKVRRPGREKRDPDYVVRARNGRGWRTIGAGWRSERDESNVIASLRINTVPVGFDGVLKIMVPLPDEEENDATE